MGRKFLDVDNQPLIKVIRGAGRITESIRYVMSDDAVFTSTMSDYEESICSVFARNRLAIERARRTNRPMTARVASSGASCNSVSAARSNSRKLPPADDPNKLEEQGLM